MKKVPDPYIIFPYHPGGTVRSVREKGENFMMLKIALPTDRPDAPVNYKEALRLSGAEAVCGSGPALSPENCSGLLLPGGIDIDPAYYGQQAEPATVSDPRLDALQLEVLQRFLKAGRPVFGICRGHQLINVALGGTLIQDLPSAERHKRLPSDEDQVHLCCADPDSWIARIYGSRFSVNSSHHQGVDRPGDGLRVVLRAQDGVAEAMAHETLPVWSVQFHPERMGFAHRRNDTVDGSLLFRFFLEQCRR